MNSVIWIAAIAGSITVWMLMAHLVSVAITAVGALI